MVNSGRKKRAERVEATHWGGPLMTGLPEYWGGVFSGRRLSSSVGKEGKEREGL